MPKHSGSDGFQDGLPGICDECFKMQKPIEANTVMVWAEVRQLGRTWGRLIRRRLDDFESVDDLMPRR